MRFTKTKILAVLVAGSFCAMPVLANAKNLVISNATPYDFAFSVNGVCSPELGMLYGFNIKHVSDADLKRICQGKSACKIETHETNCTGTYAGGLTFVENDPTVRVEGGQSPCIGDAVSVGENEIDFFFTESKSSSCLAKKK